MKFYSPLLILALCASLFSCAIDVSPQTYVHQDSKETALDLTALHAAINRDESQVGITTVSLKNAEGLELEGVAVSYANPLVNIVFYGGNGMTISQSSKLIHRFGQIPANILWLDYQGMGASEKADKITISHLKADALLVFDYAKEVFPSDIPTVVHGLSMGSLVAAYVATERDVDGLVLDGAINSVPAVVDELIPTWTRWLTRIKMDPEMAEIDNGVTLENYHGPLLLIVGEKDRVTPVEYSQQLYRLAASENKAVFVVPGAEHIGTMRDDRTIARYQEFIKSL